MSNLEFIAEKSDDKLTLKCNGRLDASRAGYLNDQINQMVRDGNYHIALDLTGIEYLSSAGIRFLISQNKNLEAVNGWCYISAMSDNVRNILSMVGLADKLSRIPDQSQTKRTETATSNRFTENDCIFSSQPLMLSATTKPDFYGEPELIKQSAYGADHATIRKALSHTYGIGLGAIGETFEECADRFGEYIQLGKNIAYMPGDGSRKPDYIIGSGQLVASVTGLYGIHFRGHFSHMVAFEHEEAAQTISVSSLLSNLSGVLPKEKKSFAVLIIGESGGLIGTSLNASPVKGRNIFSFPEVKETMNFTTEPAHLKALTVIVGIVSNDVHSAKFVRPLVPGKEMHAHLHAAIFSYIPIKKTNVDPDEVIDYLFDNAELKDIMHLTNDTREINGLGESRLAHGFCWIAPLDAD